MHACACVCMHVHVCARACVWEKEGHAPGLLWQILDLSRLKPNTVAWPWFDVVVPQTEPAGSQGTEPQHAAREVIVRLLVDCQQLLMPTRRHHTRYAAIIGTVLNSLCMLQTHCEESGKHTLC